MLLIPAAAAADVAVAVSLRLATYTCDSIHRYVGVYSRSAACPAAAVEAMTYIYGTDRCVQSLPLNLIGSAFEVVGSTKC